MVAQRDEVEPIETGGGHQVADIPRAIGVDAVPMQVPAVPAGAATRPAGSHRCRLGSRLGPEFGEGGGFELVSTGRARHDQVRIDHSQPEPGRDWSRRVARCCVASGDDHQMVRAAAVSGSA